MTYKPAKLTRDYPRNVASTKLLRERNSISPDPVEDTTPPALTEKEIAVRRARNPDNLLNRRRTARKGEFIFGITNRKSSVL